MNSTTARIISMLDISQSSLWNLKKEMKVIRELWEAREYEEEQGKHLSLRLASQPHPTKIPYKKQTFQLRRRLQRGLRFDQRLGEKFQIVHQFIYPKELMTAFDSISICC